MKKIFLLSLALSLTAPNIKAQNWSWTNRASLPQAALGSGARALGVATLNGKIYTVGGLNWPNALGTVLEYDPIADSWSQKTNMLTKRYAPAAAALNGTLYAIGGYDSGASGVYATVEAFDPIANIWTNKAPMNLTRFGHQAVALNGKIYAIGGFSSYGSATASVEEYDPNLDAWTMKADMPTPRFSFGAVVSNGKIFVIGGGNNSGAVAPCCSYNPISNSWATNANLPDMRGVPAAVSVGGKIFALGGDNGTPGGTAFVSVYDSTYNTWTRFQNMPTTRNECYAAIIEKTLYVFGGYDQWTMESTKVSPVLNLYTAVELDFATEAGKTYQIEASPDLTTWTNFGVPIVGDGTNWSKLHSTRAAGKLFFRLNENP